MMPDPRLVPPHLVAALQRYAEHRIPTGSFLRAVLENDLSGAVARADEESLRALPNIVSYVHWELPGPCWGSPATVSEWLAAAEREPSNMETFARVYSATGSTTAAKAAIGGGT